MYNEMCNVHCKLYKQDCIFPDWVYLFARITHYFLFLFKAFNIVHSVYGNCLVHYR